MSDAYSSGLAPFVDEPWPIGPNGVPRITVSKAAPPPINDEPRGIEIAPQPAPRVEQPKPIRIEPVDHTPEFHHELIPVDHTPDFADQPSNAAGSSSLSDDQLRLLQQRALKGGVIQPTGGLAPQAPTKGQHEIAPNDQAQPMPSLDQQLRTGALDLTRAIGGYYGDYFDPSAKNDQGEYVADTKEAMQPNPVTGRVPEVNKSMLSPVLGAADIASNFIGFGGPAKAIFLGAAAKTANLAKLARATQLAKLGYAEPVIRDLTGWFQGADHVWRFEISDQGAQWVGQAGVDARRSMLVDRIKAQLDEIDRLKAQPLQPNADQNALSDAKEKLGNLIQEHGQPSMMGDMLLHPELYEAYPHLARTPTVIEDLPGRRGELRPGNNSQFPTIALDTKNGADKSTALHELQHGVQDVEGFARGGNLSMPEVAAEATEQTGLRRSELMQRAMAIEEEKMAWISQQTGVSTEALIRDRYNVLGSPRTFEKIADRFWNENPDAARRMSEIEADTHQLNDAHQRALHAAYKRLAGEVEARNTQFRMDMYPEERARLEPHVTEDVSRDRQIVINRDTQQAAQSVDDEGAAAARVNDGLHETGEPVREAGYEERTHQAGAETAARPEAAVRDGGGAGGVEEARRAAESAASSTRPLEDLPQTPITIRAPGGDVVYVPGPIQRIHDIADAYMKTTGRKYEPITSYRPVEPKRATRIAEQYARMKHAPDDPAVKASYDAMIKETVDQLQHIQMSGLKIEFIKPGMENPYEASPRMATMDVRDNNHLWVFATDSGFGSGDKLTAAEIANNPLLADTGIVIDGHKVLANDAFRIVHDFFGHIKDGVGFRASGEENAWRSHSRMYSPLARKAMTAETRGQNSWVNYGPHGEKNRTAKGDTIYADQKTGIMPNWTYLDGAADHFERPDAKVINAGVDSPTNKNVQTVADPHRMMYPGIYENPKGIAREAAERVAPEDINMKRLWGVSRGDLDEMAKGRKGNRDPDIFQGPGGTRGSLAAQNIQTPKNTQRIQDILGEAGKHQGLKHADAWYILDPVYQHMEKMFGPEEAKVRFERLNTLMGMSSPGSEVTTEIQRGTAANMKVEQGKFDEFLAHAGTPKEFRKGPADLKSVEAHPYHRTAQAEPMQKYLDTGKIQSKKPKVPAYVQASGVPETGFQTRGPVVDAHFSRGIGLADTRLGAKPEKSASTPEYHTLQPWWEHEVAGDMGLESVPAQARLWTALGPRTGVTSQLGQGKLELLTTQIMKAAKRLRITPEQARDLILSGKAHAGVLAGGAVAGGVLADGLKEFVE